VVNVCSSAGAVSLEMLPLSEGVVRAFVRSSPRKLRLDDEQGRKLSDSMLESSCSRILAQDTKTKMLSRSLYAQGWTVSRAIDPKMERKHSVVGTSDLPLDYNLVDQDGKPVDLSNTGHMMGLCIPVEDRHAWAFYNDEGETARVITNGAARTGMMVVTESEDLPLMADQLVKFLTMAKKSWAVVSPDVGHHLSRYHPTPAFRMELESPAEQDHSAQPLSRANRDSATSLFSEYYDENRFKAAARVRRLYRDKAYSVFLADGGFVIVRYEKEMGLLYDIYVTPSKQGEGMGDDLMRCAIDAIHGRASGAYLHTSFPRAKRLYEKYGFRTVSSHMLLRLDEIALTPPPSR